MFQKVYAVYFSPTGNTKVLTERLAEQLAVSYDVPCEVIDFTLPQARSAWEDLPSSSFPGSCASPLRYTFTPDDLVVFGMPTYAGKLPNKILPFVRSGFAGNGAAAAALVTFGNRSFDNALAELCACLAEDGFTTVGAAAFAAQHAFGWDEKAPLFREHFAEDAEQEAAGNRLKVPGSGRPDEEDFAALAAYGRALINKISGLTDASGGMVKAAQEAGSTFTVPGRADAPYYTPKGLDGKPKNFLKAKPKTDTERCTGCGICASVCPMGSVAGKDADWEAAGICIKCHACIKACPEGAKYFDDNAYLSHRAMLVRDYSQRQRPRWFV